jgi:hypothetical protein
MLLTAHSTRRRLNDIDLFLFFNTLIFYHETIEKKCT